MSPADFDPIEPTAVAPPPEPPPPPPTRRSPWLLPGAVLLVILGLGGAYMVFRPAPVVEPAAPTVAPPPAVAPAPAPVAPAAPVGLPRLDASDDFVRQLLAALSPHPELAAWLAAGDDLVRRGVGAVLTISEGGSPRRLLAPLVPGGSFSVVERDGRLVIDPRSYERYDTITAVFTSLDANAIAAAYRTLAPLVDEAFAEIAFPGRPFADALREATRLLTAAPVPDGDLEVVATPTPGVYRYREPSLENASAAEKHLWRMGPANARRVRAKLVELATALGAAP